MILSNTTSRPELDRKAITTLGDTLLNRGNLYAAHFCYLMAEVGFSGYRSPNAKLVLLGSDHRKSFMEFATNESIHLTEIYEYACSLNDPAFLIPDFQVTFNFLWGSVDVYVFYSTALQVSHRDEIIGPWFLGTIFIVLGTNFTRSNAKSDRGGAQSRGESVSVGG